MTLYDYLELMEVGQELTVWDKDYDMETYFYSDEVDNEDKWQNTMIELSKLLTITKIRTNGVTVNLSEIIEKNISKLDKTDLFIRCDMESIMDDMENILSGFVSENWLEKFVDILK